jgi:hypothetical protein
MYPLRNHIVFALTVGILIFGCSNPAKLPTPDKIGAKERLRVISGEQAAGIVNKMHGRSVATDANVIAEYGKGKEKDILYVSRYAEPEAAEKAYKLMLEKMANAEKSPFYHLRPLAQYQGKAYMTLGMGAVHYIYQSGYAVLWFQTYQSFGTQLPMPLLKLYPI